MLVLCHIVPMAGDFGLVIIRVQSMCKNAFYLHGPRVLGGAGQGTLERESFWKWVEQETKDTAKIRALTHCDTDRGGRRTVRRHD